jgi:hypothetical protein
MRSRISSPASAQSILQMTLVLVILAIASFGLFKTNPTTGHWLQVYDPAGNWILSTLLAVLPVLMLLGAMAIVRLKAHIAAVIGLLTALAVALAVYHILVPFCLLVPFWLLAMRARMR